MEKQKIVIEAPIWELLLLGIEPAPPAVEAQSLNHWTAREVPALLKFLIIFKQGTPFFLFFLAALGLRCCAQAFSSCGERGLFFIVVHGLFIAVASLVAVHGL